jgi:hypothetical protein
MRLERYQLIATPDFETYEFFSEGPKGTIRKFIEFRKIDRRVYNLAFGDWDELNQRIDDKSRSNNSDMRKILSTVAGAVVLFLNNHRYAVLFIQGQTLAKTRLYQMGLNKIWPEINSLYDIAGFRNGIWESFTPGNNYKAFSLQLK